MTKIWPVLVKFLVTMMIMLFVGILVNMAMPGFPGFGPDPVNSFAYLVVLYSALLVPACAFIVLIWRLFEFRQAKFIYVAAAVATFISSLAFLEDYGEGLGLLSIYSIGFLDFSLRYFIRAENTPEGA
jgi:hypothetical protein